jgi:hypothetical protein
MNDCDCTNFVVVQHHATDFSLFAYLLMLLSSEKTSMISLLRVFLPVPHFSSSTLDRTVFLGAKVVITIFRDFQQFFREKIAACFFLPK